MLQIELQPDKIVQLCERWFIAELAVFGSAIREDFRPDSDVDFLVKFLGTAKWDYFDLFDLKQDLAELAGRKVDLLPIQSFTALQQHSENQIDREVIYGS